MQSSSRSWRRSLFAKTFASDDPKALKIFDTAHSPAPTGSWFSTATCSFSTTRGRSSIGRMRTVTPAGSPKGFVERSLIKSAEARDELNVKPIPFRGHGCLPLAQAGTGHGLYRHSPRPNHHLRGSLENAALTCHALAPPNRTRQIASTRYEVLADRRAEAADAICRHYSGDQRSRFCEEGLKRLTPHLFAESEQSKQ